MWRKLTGLGSFVVWVAVPRSGSGQDRTVPAALCPSVHVPGVSVSRDRLHAELGPALPGPPLAIENVTVVDPVRGRLLQGCTVLVRGTRIVAVGRHARVRVPPGSRLVDGRGRFLMPGLIDTHVHLGWDLDSAGTVALLPHYLAAGVTTVREASSRATVKAQLAARDEILSGRLPGPRLVIAGRIDARTVQRVAVADPVALARQWAMLGVDGLKVRSGLTGEQVVAVVREGRRSGLPVYGHTSDDTASYAARAVRAGLAGVMHAHQLALELPLESGAVADPPASAADEGGRWWRAYVRWTLVDPRAEEALARLLVSRGVWLEPTLATSAWSVRAPEWRDEWRADSRMRAMPRPYVEHLADTVAILPEYHDDSLTRARAAYARVQRFVRRFHSLGGIVLAGTDNFPLPAWGLHEELSLLVEAGLPPVAALRAATSDAARALGLAGVTGRIAPGLAADLLLLDADPLAEITNVRRIRAVVANGRLLDGSSSAPAVRTGSRAPRPSGPRKTSRTSREPGPDEVRPPRGLLSRPYRTWMYDGTGRGRRMSGVESAAGRSSPW